MINKISIYIVLLMLSLPLFAKDVSGVKISDDVVLAGQTLKLNGAGMRTKFIFDVYVAALYSVHEIKSVADINMQLPMRVSMHFVYDEVSKEKLVDAWNDGFEDNIESSQLKLLKNKIEKFNGLFETVHKGDVITLDYVPSKGTSISFNGLEKGIVESADFYNALLLIWLGDDPVTDELKDALLGITVTDDD